jgi:hypothetical protein
MLHDFCFLSLWVAGNFFLNLPMPPPPKKVKWATPYGCTFYELHRFSDASSKAYAAVVYLLTVHLGGEIEVSLVTSKARVWPINGQSIPRLEVLICQVQFKELFHRSSYYYLCYLKLVALQGTYTPVFQEAVQLKKSNYIIWLYCKFVLIFNIFMFRSLLRLLPQAAPYSLRTSCFYSPQSFLQSYV